MRVSSVPKYQQIAEDITTKIQQGRYLPAAKLPSENQMAKIYSTSVPTVRKALGDLVHQEVIYRIKGSGTYVCERKPLNASGGGTRSGIALTICFLVFTDSTDSSIMKMIRGAQSYLFEKGHSLSILCENEAVSSERELVHTCHDNDVDGIIYFADDPSSCEDCFALIKEYEIPVVMIDRGPKNFPHTLVAAYNTDGGYQMARYLLELGHRKIAFASLRIAFKAEKDRFMGHQMALREDGIPDHEEIFIKWCDPVAQEHLVMLAKEKKITAVQCVNDKIATEIIQRLQRENLRIPEDISVGGFDEWEETKYVVPKVTTVFQPFEDMGRTAAKKLLEIMEGSNRNSQTYLPVELKIKESCCEPMIRNDIKQELDNDNGG